MPNAPRSTPPRPARRFTAPVGLHIQSLTIRETGLEDELRAAIDAGTYGPADLASDPQARLEAKGLELLRAAIVAYRPAGARDEVPVDPLERFVAIDGWNASTLMWARIVYNRVNGLRPEQVPLDGDLGELVEPTRPAPIVRASSG